MSSPGFGSSIGNNGANGGRERGARRKRLAAMAGSVYRAGAVAVNEIKESYNQTRLGGVDVAEISKITIPGSFPEVTIVTNGTEQMVLFPSYAKRHVRGIPSQQQPTRSDESQTPFGAGMNGPAYWRQEFARHEDEKAIVDVDVRGWIYNPHKGPMTRRNRVLIGLVRQLSGVPAPSAQRVDSALNASSSSFNLHEQNEEERERQRILLEAQEIERKGRAEREAALRGNYSEQPRDEASEEEGENRTPYSSGRTTPRARPASPLPPAPPVRTNTTGGSVLSEAELAVANANLMARIGPFITTPLVDRTITLFFYNEKQAQSRTVATDDAGHFSIRAALDFIPTHVRVLANEDLSCTETVQITEPQGVSLISDIDDTVKHSNISLGAKEIFRNTFVRELKDLTVDGVKDWYTSLHEMGVSIHYCSNSPWQLYPVLATFFKLAGLPTGSLHLKRYSGMLQGIFEPVAERKKGTLEKIMHDFPERKFLLVGDSGEADLEVYTELAIANPGRIVGIFIRDVTTPERPGFFDAAYSIIESRKQSRADLNAQVQKARSESIDDDPTRRPTLPARVLPVAASTKESPTTEDLIDLSDTPNPMYRAESGSMKPGPGAPAKPPAPAVNASGRVPPPKPAKPWALQSTATVPASSTKTAEPTARKLAPAPPLPRRSFPGSEPTTQTLPLRPMPLYPLPRKPVPPTPNASEQKAEPTPDSPDELPRFAKTPEKPSAFEILPPPAYLIRRGTFASPKAASPRLLNRRGTGASDMSLDALPVFNYSSNLGNSGNSGTATPPSASGSPSQAPLNKKLELWRRRLERAHYTLMQHGVPLYTWRRGEDVVEEAKGIVRELMKRD